MASAFCQTPLRPRCELGRRQPRAQLQVVSALHIRNPYKLLGLEDNADLKDVKRAYRKLALQLHPDVSKEENAHVKFLTVTEAYELLVGRARGKEDTDHSNSNSWDFHDWYWNFRINRSWEKQQQSGSAHKPHSPGYQAPESKENVQSQLAGLRHRAAVRAQRNVQQQQEAQQQQHTPLNADPLHHSQWRPAYASSASSQSQAHSTMVDGHYGTVLGNNAVPFPTTHSTASSHHSEHSDTPAHSSAAPFPAGLHAQGLSTVSEVHSEHRYAPVDEFGEPVSPFSAPKRRPAFAAGSDARHGVSSQLQGLRRKATLKTATACGSARGSVHD